MRDQAYEIPPTQRGVTVVAPLAVALLVAAGYGAAAGHLAWAAGALGLAAALAGAAVLTLWEPHRFVLTDAGLVLHARAGDTLVSWQDLAGVVVARHGRHAKLTWVRTDGRRIVTPGTPRNHVDMLTEVKRRAPHVRTRS